jgi:predicted outer membrane protein
MKTVLLLASALTVASLAACDRRDMPENQPIPSPTTPTTDAAVPASTPPADVPVDPAAPADPQAASPDDSLALGLLGVVNEHEIAAARQAKQKQVSAPVLAFAEMMEVEHGANQAKTQSLGTLASTDEVKAMQEKGATELATLGQKSGKEYETAYVEAMVKGHTDALALIDTRLLTLASAEAVKQHFTTTRDAVAKHLEHAKKLQAGQ